MCVCEKLKFLRLLQNQVQATHLFLEDDDLGWGTPGLGDDLGWGGEVTRDAQGCGGGPPPLGLLERDISSSARTLLARFDLGNELVQLNRRF